MDLHTAGHRRGVVAAPHAAAAEAGRQILAEGGNAIEAMVAMAAAIAVVYPHMNQLGGDGFWLLREPSGRVRALMAAGVAGSRARPELYREAGLEAIPPRGPLAALTVPGAVAGWILALEAAHAFGGKLPLAELLGPAIRHAGEGFAISRSHAACAAWPTCAARRDSPRPSWPTASRRRRAASCSSRRSPPPSTSSPARAWRISTAAMSAARSPAISSASAAR